MTCAVYIFLGIVIVKKSGRSSLTVLFLSVSSMLAVWSLGYALGISADSYADSLSWYRFASLGWNLFYALLLHFSIHLTVKDAGSDSVIDTDHGQMNHKPGLKPFAILPVYIPAIIFIYAYALSGELSSMLFNLEKTSAGWINRPGNNNWERAFVIYYLSYHLITLFLIVRRGLKTKDLAVRNQTKLLTLSLIAAGIAGTMSDRFADQFISRDWPQVAPVIVIVPMLAAYYAIRHYGLLGLKQVNDDELILDSKRRRFIYDGLSFMLIIGGIIVMFVQYIISIRSGQSNLEEQLFAGGAFFAASGVLYLINHLKFFDGIRDPVFALIQAVAVPFIVLSFADIAGITIWALPAIPLLLAILYNSRFALAVISVSSICTLLLIAISTPPIDVNVDASDHIARLTLLTIIIIGAVQVNKLYLNRLKQNADQIKLQKQISKLTNLFLDADMGSMQQSMTELLRSSAGFLGADSGAVYLDDDNGSYTTRTYIWQDEDISIFDIDNSRSVLSEYSWTSRQVRSRGLLIIKSLEAIPPEEVFLRSFFQDHGLKSLIIKPIREKHKIVGVISFGSCRGNVDWDEQQIEFVNILANISASALERVKHESVIQTLAYYDRLTGLVNRSRFLEIAQDKLISARRHNHKVAVVFLDLDSFKAVNDSLGHDAGDELLHRLALQMKQKMREADLLGRFGGDEFLIMLDPVYSENEISEILSPIMELFQQSIRLRGNRYQVTISAGIAVYPRDGEDLDTLIKNADLAMYEAKSHGKNRIYFCNDQLKNSNAQQAVLSNDLHDALEQKQLFLHYQPQIDLKTNMITGVEALLRWQHPKYGMISPVDFIPLAEKNGMIHAIGEYVLYEACLEARKWQQKGLNLTIAVNLSLRQLRSASLVRRVEHILLQTGLNPELLELEITESVASWGAEEMKQLLTELKSTGVKLAIDDFGTQYSSLNRISQLPVDRIKIDRQFISNLPDDIKDSAIVNLIISLAAKLGIEIVAEGVESAEQNEFLRSIGCNYVQGFYHYQPMSASDLDSILFS
ncbi:MAG: EAL domain-containing protein [Eubacteriales bacterium]|nr:EAL domain-containing protein [Eubacteriales bacterium]